MRRLGKVITAASLAALAGQGAFLIRAHRRDHRASGAEPGQEPNAGDRLLALVQGARRPPASDTVALPPPRFAAPAGVASALADGDSALRQEVIERQREALERETRESLAASIQALGLDPERAEKLADLMGRVEATRTDVVERMQAHQLSSAEADRAFADWRLRTDQELRALLGDEKVLQFQIMQRRGIPGLMVAAEGRRPG